MCYASQRSAPTFIKESLASSSSSSSTATYTRVFCFLCRFSSYGSFLFPPAPSLLGIGLKIPSFHPKVL